MLCRYERTIFKSDKGFCIFSYSTEDQSVPKEAHNRSFYHDDKIHFTAIGYHLVASNAVEVELDGTWENSKHGLQLSVSMCKEIVPTNQAGILAYLSSGVIKGVGPEIAKAIVARFGDKTMEVLDKEPQKLLSIKGIAQRKLKAIIASYEETKALSDLMIYLAPFGVSMKKAAMIKEEFGDNSLKIVKSDPFQLCKIKGFGFMTVDSIARKTKVSLKHPMRYSGAINYVLDEARVSGHLFLTVDETVGQCYDLLNSDCEEEVVSEEEIRQAITNERVESRVYVEGSRVYLSYERMCEVKAAKRIVSMLLQEGFDEIRDLDEKIDRAEKNLHQRLAPSQRNAVKLCLSYPISIMTGGPGSGKTTTLYAAIHEIQDDSVSIATLEDPVEILMEGISQSQVQAKGGMMFQDGLRALLRQDPDILVVGEIRDGETARIAVRAALTGHVIFSTLHAPSAVEAVIRLTDMGVAPYLAADALAGVVSQRLVRCRRSDGSYQGRFCLCEVVPAGRRLRDAIRRCAGVRDLTDAARSDGAVLLPDVIARTLAAGRTDEREIRRVCEGGSSW